MCITGTEVGCQRQVQIQKRLRCQDLERGTSEKAGSRGYKKSAWAQPAPCFSHTCSLLHFMPLGPSKFRFSEARSGYLAVAFFSASSISTFHDFYLLTIPSILCFPSVNSTRSELQSLCCSMLFPPAHRIMTEGVGPTGLTVAELGGMTLWQHLMGLYVIMQCIRMFAFGEWRIIIYLLSALI